MLKAFPGQSMEELQAAATAVLAGNPNLGVDDLVVILADKFDVSVSSEKAAAIRTEWEEFNQVSELSPSELMEVLDDYSGDSVNTKGQKYLLLLVNLLRQELSELTSKTDEADLEAEKSKFESRLGGFGGQSRWCRRPHHQGKGPAMAWGCLRSRGGRRVRGPRGYGDSHDGRDCFGHRRSRCHKHVPVRRFISVASAATGEDYSLANVASEVMQWIWNTRRCR